MRDSKLHRIILKELSGANNILDVGCGEGDLVNFLAKAMKRRIVGLDISNSGFNKAMGTAAKSGIPHLVRCVKGDAHRIAQYFNGEEFDAVIMTYALHHFKYPQIVLREIQNILQPDGKVLVADWVLHETGKKEECRRFYVRDILGIIKKADYDHVKMYEMEAEFVLVTAEN